MMDFCFLITFEPLHAKVNLPMMCYALLTLTFVWWYLRASKQKGNFETQRFRPMKLLLIGLGAMMFGVMTIISTAYVWVLKPVTVEGKLVSYGKNKVHLSAPSDVYIHIQKKSSPYAPDMVVDSVRILVLDNQREDIIKLSENDFAIDSIMSLLKGLDLK